VEHDPARCVTLAGASMQHEMIDAGRQTLDRKEHRVAPSVDPALAEDPPGATGRVVDDQADGLRPRRGEAHLALLARRVGVGVSSRTAAPVRDVVSGPGSGTGGSPGLAAPRARMELSGIVGIIGIMVSAPGGRAPPMSQSARHRRDGDAPPSRVFCLADLADRPQFGRDFPDGVGGAASMILG